MSDPSLMTESLTSPLVRWDAMVVGASGGIGSEYCRALAAKQLNLIISGRNQNKLHQLATELNDQFGIQVQVLRCDLTNRTERDKVIDSIRQNAAMSFFVNASGMVQWGRATEFSSEEMREMFEVNVIASIELLREAVMAFRQRKNGRIVHVASAAAFYSVPYLAGYCASKAAVVNFIRSLMVETQGHGVALQALCPGFVKTNMFAIAGADTDRIPSFLWLSSNRVVKESLRQIERGSSICVPGLMYQIFAWNSRFTPAWISTRIAGRLFGQFSKFRIASKGMT